MGTNYYLIDACYSYNTKYAMLIQYRNTYYK